LLIFVLLYLFPLFFLLLGLIFRSFASLLKSIPNWLSVGVCEKLVSFFSLSILLFILFSSEAFSVITFNISSYIVFIFEFRFTKVLTAMLSPSFSIPN